MVIGLQADDAVPSGRGPVQSAQRPARSSGWQQSKVPQLPAHASTLGFRPKPSTLKPRMPPDSGCCSTRRGGHARPSSALVAPGLLSNPGHHSQLGWSRQVMHRAHAGPRRCPSRMGCCAPAPAATRAGLAGPSQAALPAGCRGAGRSEGTLMNLDPTSAASVHAGVGWCGEATKLPQLCTHCRQSARPCKPMPGGGSVWCIPGCRRRHHICTCLAMTKSWRLPVRFWPPLAWSQAVVCEVACSAGAVCQPSLMTPQRQV